MLPQVNIIRAKNGDFMSFFESAGISGVLTAHGVWDEPTIEISKALIDLVDRKPVVLDIGANMGTYSIAIARHIYLRGGIVHAFEPQRVVYYQLCGNIFLNRFDCVYAHNIALSNRKTLLEINPLDFHTAWNIGAYSLVPGFDAQIHSNTCEYCQVDTLNDFPISDPVTLIKMDVEGMEMDVINGAFVFLEKNKFPPIFFESLEQDQRSQDVKISLADLGYDILQYANNDYLAQHRNWPSQIAIDFSQSKPALVRIR